MTLFFLVVLVLLWSDGKGKHADTAHLTKVAKELGRARPDLPCMRVCDP